MLMTIIKSLIFIPYLLLSGCGEYINIYLDNKFPVNMNNDGNKITVYSTISPETVVNLLVRIRQINANVLILMLLILKSLIPL